MSAVSVPRCPPSAFEALPAWAGSDLIAPTDQVLVGVSGGADSTALAVLLARSAEGGAATRPVLGHVDHGWRGPAAAERDWRQIEELARRLGVRALRSSPPPPGTPRTEDAARRHRYRVLRRMAEQVGAKKVALAHHLGDQAETFVMRLLRGSGLMGLAGIPRRRALGASGIEVVRPLLEVDPQWLRDLLRADGIAWIEDLTNTDVTRDRARIRARLAGHRTDDLARLAGRLRRRVEERERAVVGLARDQWCAYPHAGAVRLPRAWLQSLDNPLLLGLALRAAGRTIGADEHGPWFTRRHLQLGAGLLARGGALDLPRGVRLHVAGGGAWLARRLAPEVVLPTLHVDPVASSTDAPQGGPDSVVVDGGVLGPTPVVRLLQPGDAFVPFGSSSGRLRPVARWLSRQGVPEFARRGVLVVIGARGVAWVVGERIDARHAVGRETTQAVRLEVGRAS